MELSRSAPRGIATVLLFALAGCPLTLSDFSIGVGDAGGDASNDASLDAGGTVDGSADTNADGTNANESGGASDGGSADVGENDSAADACTVLTPSTYSCNSNGNTATIHKPTEFCSLAPGNAHAYVVNVPAQCQCAGGYSCACLTTAQVQLCTTGTFQSCQDTIGDLVIRCQ